MLYRQGWLLPPLRSPDAQYAFIMSLINELQKRDVIGTNVNASGFTLSKMVDEFGLSEISDNSGTKFVEIDNTIQTKIRIEKIS